MTAVARKQLPLRPAGPDTVDALLAWYDEERRDLPWRARRGERADPYGVWLSEIMLQQTTVKAVIPYYLSDSSRAGRRWRRSPRRRSTTCSRHGRGSATTRAPATCTNAPQVVAREHGGEFPATAAELQKLPGIGPYTAAAIAAIAFGEPATPVDGNIERVVARLFAVRQPLPGGQERIATRSPRR